MVGIKQFKLVMIMKERLLSEMASFAAESKWEEVLTETINEMFEIRPSNPYLFLQKKISLKQKLQNSKGNQYLLELALYLSHVDPLVATPQTIKDKIISLCVEKYQHTKIKKTEIGQLISIILLPFEPVQKDYFVKLTEQLLDHEIYTILQYAEILLYTVTFRAMLQELTRLQSKLNQFRLSLDRNTLIQYINTVNESHSILRSSNLQLQEDGNVYKVVASEVVLRVNI